MRERTPHRHPDPGLAHARPGFRMRSARRRLCLAQHPEGEGVVSVPSPPEGVNLLFAYRGHSRAGACPPPSVARPLDGSCPSRIRSGDASASRRSMPNSARSDRREGPRASVRLSGRGRRRCRRSPTPRRRDRRARLPVVRDGQGTSPRPTSKIKLGQYRCPPGEGQGEGARGT